MRQLSISKEVIQQAGNSMLKIVFGFIPGAHVVDEFLDFRGNLKQQRIIKFSESVKVALEEISNKKIDSENFTTEDFVDVCDSVMYRVQNTRSIYKLDRFRNIMVRQIVDPIDSHETLKFVHILDDLQDVDLVILLKMRYNDDMSYRTNFQKMLTGSDELLEDDSPVHIDAGGNNIEITVGDIEFYVNRLTTLGLFKLRTVQMTTGGGGRKRSTTKNYQTLLISNMGKKFLDFIETSEN